MSREKQGKIKFVFNILNYTMDIWKSIKSVVYFRRLHSQRLLVSSPGTPGAAPLRKNIFSRSAKINRVGEQGKNPFKKRFLRVFPGYLPNIPKYRNPIFAVLHKMNETIRSYKVLPVN
jgi:hypothetical protein